MYLPIILKATVDSDFSDKKVNKNTLIFVRKVTPPRKCLPVNHTDPQGVHHVLLTGVGMAKLTHPGQPDLLWGGSDPARTKKMTGLAPTCMLMLGQWVCPLVRHAPPRPARHVIWYMIYYITYNAQYYILYII